MLWRRSGDVVGGQCSDYILIWGRVWALQWATMGNDRCESFVVNISNVRRMLVSNTIPACEVPVHKFLKSDRNFSTWTTTPNPSPQLPLPYPLTMGISSLSAISSYT